MTRMEAKLRQILETLDRINGHTVASTSAGDAPTPTPLVVDTQFATPVTAEDRDIISLANTEHPPVMSTRAVAAAMEWQETTENTAAEADATVTAGSTTAAAMAAASAGSSAGGAAGDFVATARAEYAIRGRSRPDHGSARAADASRARSPLRRAARASACSVASATSMARKLPSADSELDTPMHIKCSTKCPEHGVDSDDGIMGAKLEHKPLAVMELQKEGRTSLLHQIVAKLDNMLVRQSEMHASVVVMGSRASPSPIYSVTAGVEPEPSSTSTPPEDSSFARPAATADGDHDTGLRTRCSTVCLHPGACTPAPATTPSASSAPSTALVSSVPSQDCALVIHDATIKPPLMVPKSCSMLGLDADTSAVQAVATYPLKLGVSEVVPVAAEYVEAPSRRTTVDVELDATTPTKCSTYCLRHGAGSLMSASASLAILMVPPTCATRTITTPEVSLRCSILGRGQGTNGVNISVMPLHIASFNVQLAATLLCKGLVELWKSSIQCAKEKPRPSSSQISVLFNSSQSNIQPKSPWPSFGCNQAGVLGKLRSPVTPLCQASFTRGCEEQVWVVIEGQLRSVEPEPSPVLVRVEMAVMQFENMSLCWGLVGTEMTSISAELIHWSPPSSGTSMFLLALYLLVEQVKRNTWHGRLKHYCCGDVLVMIPAYSGLLLGAANLLLNMPDKEAVELHIIELEQPHCVIYANAADESECRAPRWCLSATACSALVMEAAQDQQDLLDSLSNWDPRYLQRPGYLQLPWDPGGSVESGLGASRVLRGGECHVQALLYQLPGGASQGGNGCSYKRDGSRAEKGIEQNRKAVAFFLLRLLSGFSLIPFPCFC